MKFSVVHENPHVIVIDKPHGWLTTPAREADDPRPCLGRELQAELGQQIFPVHRLDFEVSGLVIFARTREAHRDTQKWFEDGSIVKTYQALSKMFGDISEWKEWRQWKSCIAKGKRRAFEAPHGKDAVTRARVIEELNKLWRWELMPLTGRPHQLRFEMSKRGFPILGDTLYGGEKYGGEISGEENWMALRAVQLDLNKVAPDRRFDLPAILTVAPLSDPR